MFDEPVFGQCCICEREAQKLVGMIMIEKLAPSKEHGWMCFQCGAGKDHKGALAVACVDCADKMDAGQEPPLKLVCAGAITNPARVPIESLIGEIVHDVRLHPELVMMN